MPYIGHLSLSLFIAGPVKQTCKSSADPQNSGVFDIPRVILDICPDQRRK